MDTGDHGLDPVTPTPKPAPQPAPRGMMLGAVVVLSGFVLSQGPTLYDEVNGLMAERDRSRLAHPIGFIDIAPHPSYAIPPKDWAHLEGDELLLWSGWDRDTHGHAWFRVGKTDLDTRTLHIPMGCDIVRTIDQTRLESQDGLIWSRMQPEMLVLPVRAESNTGSSHYAYPLMLLEKVQAVNDTVAGRPLLVLFTPFVPMDQAVDLFDPMLDGDRVRLASSGHYIEPGRRPLMYDRDHRDLWARQPQGMVCVAGDRKGAVLKRLPMPATVPWSDWSDEHPDGHLIVGAVRPEAPATSRPRTPSATAALARAGGPVGAAVAP